MTAVAMAFRFACLGIVLGGCDYILQPTKVAGGQLYQSGDGKYDPYFAAVHQEQLASANWPDEAKSSRKPVVTALDLRPGASNFTILSATRSKKGEASLSNAIEQTTASESERARRLTAAAAKLDDMQKRGEELKKQTVIDKKNLGADKADDAKVAKKDEVKREMAAAVDSVESMASDARKGAKEAEELATKLKAAWTGKDDDERRPRFEEKKRDEEKKEERKDEEKREEKKKPEPVAKKPAKPEAPVAKKPAKPEPEEKKAPEEKPAKAPPPQKPADEVFNP
ncbi:MAG TPA: hypothetical protein VM925_18865 [Labilithrix sp.]|nr:hypothetical protein [Labilithrix sp.]